MRAPEFIRALNALAPGKTITVTAAGQTYCLPEPLPPVPPREPDPIEVLAAQLRERDAEAARNAAAAGQRADEAMNAVKQLGEQLAEGQAKVEQSVGRLEGTLHLPVKPLYDKAGKLIGAQRVKKLGASNAG